MQMLVRLEVNGSAKNTRMNDVRRDKRTQSVKMQRRIGTVRRRRRNRHHRCHVVRHCGEEL